MKRLLACLAVISCVAASAQYDNAQFPYNPDSEPDGYIGVGDVLEILSIFGSQFDVATLSADSSSALVHIGETSYWECSRSCKALGREWSVMDADGFTAHSDSLLQFDTATDLSANVWAWLETDLSTTYLIPSVRLAGVNLGEIDASSPAGGPQECYCTARIYPELEYTFAASTNSLNFINDCATLLNDGWRPLGGINTRTISNPPAVYSQSFWRYVPD